MHGHRNGLRIETPVSRFRSIPGGQRGLTYIIVYPTVITYY